MCRPPPTDRNPTSCSAARTCDRPPPPPQRACTSSSSACSSPRPPAPLPALCDRLAPTLQVSSARRPGPRKSRSRVAPPILPKEASKPLLAAPALLGSLGASRQGGGWQDGQGRPEARRLSRWSRLLLPTADSRERSPPSRPGQLAQLAPHPYPEPPWASPKSLAAEAGQQTPPAPGLLPPAQPAPARPPPPRARVTPAPACRSTLEEPPPLLTLLSCTQRALPHARPPSCLVSLSGQEPVCK